MKTLVNTLKVNRVSDTTYIPCASFDEWKRVLKLLYDNGLEWNSLREKDDAQEYYDNYSMPYKIPCLIINWFAYRVTHNIMYGGYTERELKGFSDVVSATDLLKKYSSFKLEDIKQGYVVITRDDETYMAMSDTDGKMYFVDNLGFYFNHEPYDENLEHKHWRECDIMYVYGSVKATKYPLFRLDRTSLMESRELLYSREQVESEQKNKYIQMNIDDGMIYKRSPLKEDK